VNLRGSRLEGPLILGDARFSTLRLSDVKTRSLDLSDGFEAYTTYLDALDYLYADYFVQHPLEETLKWLNRGNHYAANGIAKSSPQSYEHMALVLERAGDWKKAREVRRAAISLCETQLSGLHKLFSYIYGKLAGYGYCPGRLVWVAIVLWGIGVIIIFKNDKSVNECLNSLSCTGYTKYIHYIRELKWHQHLFDAAFFSFSFLVPVEIVESTQRKEAEKILGRYANFMRLCGWIIIVCILIPQLQKFAPR
jgi:hypothetical protein